MASYVGLFRVPESGAIVPKIVSLAAITMEVSEVVTLHGDHVMSNALVSFSNVDINEGKATDVIIEHKRSGSVTWKTLASFKTKSGSNNGQPWIGQDNSGSFLVQDMEYRDTGLNHDFRAYFQNTDGELAQDLNNGGKLIGVATADGGAGYAQDTGVTFNGVTDLSEYPGADNVLVVNSDNSGGGTFNNPANLPNTGIARLTWDDMRFKGDSTNHPMADGTTENITEQHWKTLRGYLIFMFIADTQAPLNEYPEVTPLNGAWYLVGETYSRYAEVDCPQNKKVGFYVAVKLKISATTTPTGEVPYTEY